MVFTIRRCALLALCSVARFFASCLFALCSAQPRFLPCPAFGMAGQSKPFCAKKNKGLLDSRRSAKAKRTEQIRRAWLGSAMPSRSAPCQQHRQNAALLLCGSGPEAKNRLAFAVAQKKRSAQRGRASRRSEARSARTEQKRRGALLCPASPLRFASSGRRTQNRSLASLRFCATAKAKRRIEPESSSKSLATLL